MSDSGVTIRAYETGDEAATIECFMMAVRRTAAADYSPNQLKAWAPDGWDQLHWGKHRIAARTLVAELDGRVVGFADMSETGYIDMLYVHPTVERQGVATTLLGTLIDQSSREGLPRLTAQVSKTARRVFERAGFKVDAEQEVMTNGVVLVNYTMARIASR